MKTTEAELQQLRIAVAEAEGWTQVPSLYFAGEMLWKNPEGRAAGNVKYMHIPDYPADRNAIIGAIVRRFVDCGKFPPKFHLRLNNMRP